MDVVTNLGANLLKFAEIYDVREYFFAEGLIGAWFLMNMSRMLSC